MAILNVIGPLLLLIIALVVFVVIKKLMQRNIHLYFTFIAILLFVLGPIVYYLTPSQDLNNSAFPKEYFSFTEGFRALATDQDDGSLSSYVSNKETIPIEDSSPLFIEAHTFSFSLLYIERVDDLDREVRVVQYDSEKSSDPFYLSVYQDEYEDNQVLAIDFNHDDSIELNLFSPSFITTARNGTSETTIDLIEEHIDAEPFHSTKDLYSERLYPFYKQGIHLQIPADLEIDVQWLQSVSAE